MAKPRLSNLLVISVEWGRSRGDAHRLAMDRLAGRLLEQFEQWGIKATWGVPDLRHPAVGSIAAAAPDHELALDATVQTPSLPQHVPAFVNWLKDRRQRAADAGVDLRSLVLDSAGLHPYQQLAQIGFVALRTNGRLAEGPVQPQPLRFGLFSLTVSQRWPNTRRRWPSIWWNRRAQSIDASQLSSGIAHVLFDLSSMAADTDGSLRQLQRFLDAAVRLKERQGLRSACLGDTPRLAREGAAVQPAQSILRKVA